MNLTEYLKSTQFKAYLSASEVSTNIVDADVLTLFDSLKFQHEFPSLFVAVLKNIHNADINANEIDPWFQEFYMLMTNEVLGLFAQEEIDLSEMEKYHFGLGRNILVLSKLSAEKIIRKDQVKHILKFLMTSKAIGLDFDELILNSDFFKDEDVSQLDSLLDEALSMNQKAVEEFKSGKEKALMSIVGYIMKKAKHDPKIVIELLKQKILN